ncbi:GTP cyclohydrolase II [Salmonella enterica subsp. enterica]|uniref:GTP cyclohydrolase II n=1 Tax=Salmonella enterica I TaxID=59201 RepID=A0A447U2I7_SALET|nr:GTP cyclohydrolase II [Salmonella enterica subsp. enterica]
MTRWRPIISSALPPMSVISPFARICSKLLGVDEVRLLTNNPKKVEILTEAGI